MTTVSFPGLGIPEFTMDKIAFSLGKINVAWYGLIITCGIILAFLYCAYRAKQEGIVFDSLLDIAIYTIIISVIGARCGYVLFSLGDYTKYLKTDGFWKMIKEMINIPGGGLQIYGAIIAGAITIFVVCKIKKINPLKMLDAVSPAVMIGQFIGRWGNFVNGEAHGTIVSENSPLYFIRMGLSPYHMDGKLMAGYAEVHPTFLYESVWNIIGFIIIHCIYKKKKFDGQIVLMYLSWYGFGRMLIEMLRTDSLTLAKLFNSESVFLGSIRVSVVIGAICFIGGVALLIYGFIKNRQSARDEGEYSPTYAKISHYGEATVRADEAPEGNASEAEATVDEDEPEEPTEDIGYTEDIDEIEKKFSSLLGEDDKDKRGN